MTTTGSLPHNLTPYDDDALYSPWWIRIPILLVLGLFLALVLLMGLLMGFQMAYRDLIVPNVWVQNVPLGGLTLAEAQQQLEREFRMADQAIFTFRDGDAFWQVSASELGVQFDAEATALQAYRIAHTGAVFDDLLTQLRTLLTGTTLSPMVVYDQQQALERLLAIRAEIDQASLSASLTMNGAELVAVEGQSGRQLDVTRTLQRLEERLLTLSGGEIPLVILETPPLVVSVADVRQQIETALSAPVQLVANDAAGAPLGPWTASTEQIAQLLRVETITNSDGTQSFAARIDASAFADYLQTLAPGLIAPAQNARYRFNAQTGQLEVTQPAISGRTLNVQETIRRLEDAVFNPDNRVVPMVFDFTLPRYHNQISAAELGIREMVAESTTYFVGSPQSRRTNIALAASKFDGIIIGPGEEFSFNYFLGEINEEGGFLEGNVIVGDRTVIGIGGGTCQVSTTVFRAAFYGGYAITERNSHGYRVGYYEQGGMPPGLDAAIWQPERDFRFQNNTPYHILIETSIYPANSALQFRFYSTRFFNTEVDPAIVKNITPARPVRYEANPQVPPGQSIQVDYSAEGADVTVYRRVYDLNGNLLVEDFVFTHYLPWGAIFQVAPGDSRLGSS